ncbi:uncharacterized protein [Clytia hemisphaerica]|uniref:uncharacterized protein isoform X1 n=2 Tax=Clytia hemisphaerica TaxID=252671 RepID=UPI0034D59693
MKLFFRALLFLSLITILQCRDGGYPYNAYDEYLELATTSKPESSGMAKRILIPVQIILVGAIASFVLYRKCRYPDLGLFEFNKKPLEGFTNARDDTKKPYVELSETMSSPSMTLTCPQVKDQIWTKEAERHFLPPTREDFYESPQDDEYLEPVVDNVESHEYVSIEMDDPFIQQRNNKDIPDVENLRIDPVKRYVEPYEEDRRQTNGYSPGYDCYYDNVDHILSNHEQMNNRQAVVEEEGDYTNLTNNNTYNDDDAYETLDSVRSVRSIEAARSIEAVQSENIYEEINPGLPNTEPDPTLPFPLFFALAAYRFKNAALRTKEELEQRMFGTVKTSQDEAEDDNAYTNINPLPDVAKIKAKYRSNEPGSRVPVPAINKNRGNSNVFDAYSNVIDSLTAKAEKLSNQGSNQVSSRTRSKTKKMKSVDGSFDQTIPKENSRSRKKTNPSSNPQDNPETRSSPSSGKRKPPQGQDSVLENKSAPGRRKPPDFSQPPAIAGNRSGSSPTRKKGRDPQPKRNSMSEDEGRSLSLVSSPPEKPKSTETNNKKMQQPIKTLAPSSSEDDACENVENTSSVDSIPQRLQINPKLTSYLPFGQDRTHNELLENSKWKAVQDALHHHSPIFPPIKLVERQESNSDWSTNSKDDLLEKERQYRIARRVIAQFQNSAMPLGEKDSDLSSAESLHLEEMLETEQNVV